MKAERSEAYYRECKDILFEKYRRFCDYEGKLEMYTRFMNDLDLPADKREQAEAAVRKMEAQKIADRARKELLEKMRQIKDIKAGVAGLGYTTGLQEIQAWYDLKASFEFSCWMLKEFKRKYDLV